MEDAESKNHEEDIQKPWESLISEKQLVTEFTKGQLVPTSSGMHSYQLFKTILSETPIRVI